jgi:hypothetical protein
LLRMAMEARSFEDRSEKFEHRPLLRDWQEIALVR